jgi:hypothetical protein
MSDREKANGRSAAPSLTRSQLETLTRHLTREGKLIEAGFAGLRIACKLEDAPADQLDQMRSAFFAGALHLFASIVTVLDPGSEPTDADMASMSRIDAELRAFSQDFELRHLPTEGRA